MASPLMAGSVAVGILGDNKNILNIINQTHVAIENGLTKFPGFQGRWAVFRDIAVSVGSLKPIFEMVTASIMKFSAVFSDFVQYGDQMAKMSQRTGVSAEELSLLGYAAGQSGSSIDSLGNGIKKLQKNLVEASRGEKTAAENFEHLGLSAAYLNTLSASDRILVIADAIRDLGDEALQAEAAMRIFGKGGVDLLPFLQEGSKGIAALMDEAKINGIGISDEDAQKAVVLGDTIDRLKATIQGLKTEFAASFAPMLNDIIDSIRKFTAENRELVVWLAQKATQLTIAATVLKLLSATYAGLNGVVKSAIALSTQMFAAKTKETAAETANSAARTSNAIVTTWKISADGQQLLMTNATTAATVRNTIGTIANTVAKKANLMLTKSLSAATLFCTNAWKALTISMAANPIMWIGAAVGGLASLVGYLALANEYQAKLSNAAVETSTKNNDTRNTDDRKFQYLDQLSQKQELTNKEMQDAEKIIGELEGRYGDLGLSIDKTTGKIIKAADAQKKLNEEMNRQALRDAEAELAEGETNFSELEKQKESIGWYWRSVMANVTGGFVDTAEDQIEKIGDKAREQMQKNNELRKKIAALKGGEDWRDVNNPDDIVTKTAVVEQENAAALKELENAEKRLQEMQDTMRRDNQTAVQNEIEDLRKRNDEYDKYTKLLLEAEKAKGNLAGHDKIAKLQDDLGNL
ncbi:hypothetical protein FACS1894189_4560 [Planctomycetales bacterium]|nr:hypothetical protein FACS1894189_4560 [Planctomycetales bacterium]